MNEQQKSPLVVILGPTASGKTEVSLQLAERFGGEIVSADSRSFYRGLDIGTAKPTAAELARAPHHLIDIADPDDVINLARFQDLARKTIAEIHARGRLPLLVGGTGQYVRALTEGWELPRVEPEHRLRTVLEDWARQIGRFALHDRLAVLDPQAASEIDPHNLRRTVRALEVILSSGRRFSDQRYSTGSAPYDLLLLGITRPRPELYARVDARIDAMIAAGLVDEVRGLLAQGYSPTLPALSAIGYREIIPYLKGEISLDESVIQIKRDTRVFVRRQANWFKLDDPAIHWFPSGPETAAAMETTVRKWLASRK